jgi:hypothetical protein
MVSDEPKLHRRTLSPSPSLRKKGTPSCTLLGVTTVAQDPLR